MLAFGELLKQPPRWANIHIYIYIYYMQIVVGFPYPLLKHFLLCSTLLSSRLGVITEGKARRSVAATANKDSRVVKSGVYCKSVFVFIQLRMLLLSGSIHKEHHIHNQQKSSHLVQDVIIVQDSLTLGLMFFASRATYFREFSRGR